MMVISTRLICHQGHGIVISVAAGWCYRGRYSSYGWRTGDDDTKEGAHDAAKSRGLLRRRPLLCLGICDDGTGARVARQRVAYRQR
jgi:hypothetical protein